MSDPYGREWVPTESKKPEFFSLARPFKYAFYTWLTCIYFVYYFGWTGRANYNGPTFILAVGAMAIVSCVFIPLYAYIGVWTWALIVLFHLFHLASVFVFHLNIEEGREHWKDRLVG